MTDTVNPEFARWALGETPDVPYPGCDGGDPGEPASPSIWVFGIEWGWSKKDQLTEEVGETEPVDLLYSVKSQLNWPYNRNTFKLLAAINGENPRNFREFAHSVRAFEKGSKGYFKGNIYPIPFNRVDKWDEQAVQRTGLKDKSAYQTWCKENRFSVISEWRKVHRPNLFIGVGSTFLSDFQKIAGVEEVEKYEFTVNGHKKTIYWGKRDNLNLLVVPHLSGSRFGLNSYKSLEEVGSFVRKRLADRT